jgi:hypothetical protein
MINNLINLYYSEMRPNLDGLLRNIEEDENPGLVDRITYKWFHGINMIMDKLCLKEEEK